MGVTDVLTQHLVVMCLSLRGKSQLTAMERHHDKLLMTEEDKKHKWF